MTDHTVLINQMLILVFFAELFSLLHIIAAISQTRKTRLTGNWMMLTGGLLLQLAVALCITGSPLDWEVALFGSLLVFLNALLNGRRSGNLHWQHHAVRAVIAVGLVAGFALL